MRKFLLGLAFAGSALFLASPASAQYYARGYGYGYGANQYSSIEVRLQNVIGSINSAPYYRQNQLRAEAFSLERSVRYAAQRGLDPWALIGNRLTELELQVQRAVH